ncbi:hypothetical protein RIN66_04065 [Hafnia alvei]|uniref:hypothetical protein n=1 Tax=Hafnia alvei TaxID=569 RepID=UPI0028BED0CD|nr:hypothetical protein [Hafnia alvei]WNN53246.1 hypothetical protein RIN66_04065 [Hafnia alvei]
MDDKQVALTLAFDLYIKAKRPRSWRETLKRVVKVNEVLTQRLNSLLHPPIQDEETRRRRSESVKWLKRQKIEQEKEKKKQLDWKIHLTENVERLVKQASGNPGVLTNEIWYLYEEICSERRITEYRTQRSEPILMRKFGEHVTRFYRDATALFWRHYKPGLRSEGFTHNEIKWEAYIGLTGLEMEAMSVANWPIGMTIGEANLVCRYAAFELNGFPFWFEKLYNTFPHVVTDFLINEIHYELSISTIEDHWGKTLETVRRSGEWVWESVGSELYSWLENSEPNNFYQLVNSLKIIHGTNLSDQFLAVLAAKKCQSLTDVKHLSLWYVVWVGVEPQAAIESLKAHLENISIQATAIQFSMLFITTLCGDSPNTQGFARPAFKNACWLKTLYLLMRQYIIPDEDVNIVSHRNFRRDAQEARDRLCIFLMENSGKTAYEALIDIAYQYPDDVFRLNLLSRAKFVAAKDANISPWSAEQVKIFSEQQERKPGNHRELAELAVFRLLDLKDDIEQADSSIAAILQGIKSETVMRNFIARELREKAAGRYTITQEEEFADAKRPDLRFHGNGFDNPVPVELKLAENWTGPNLFERLENQLCRDYLRDVRSTYGLFVLVYGGVHETKAHWQMPDGDLRFNFEQLIEQLQQHWHNVAEQYPNIEEITVIGIDLKKRSNRQKK